MKSLDKPDLVEVRAPKPTQILLTTEDNCFPYAGGRRAAAEAQAAFTALGSASALDVQESVYHHGWDRQNREKLYHQYAVVVFSVSFCARAADHRKSAQYMVTVLLYTKGAVYLSLEIM